MPQHGIHLDELTRRILRRRRKALGWTQADLGGRCQLTATSIRRIERGEHSPPDAVLRRLADTLGLSCEVFPAVVVLRPA